MDPVERKKISENLYELVKATFCSAIFLRYFCSRSVFSESDVELIETEERKNGRSAASSQFYDLLVSRSGSFIILLDALQETKQTGALDILNNVTNSESASIKRTRKRFTSKSPKYIDDYISRQEGCYLIVCSDDCKLTCDWILESTTNCKLYSITDILEKLSDSVKPLDENSVLLVTLETNLEPIHIIELNKPLKLVFVTQLKQSKLEEEIPHPTTAWKIVQDNIQYNDLSMSAKLKITSGLKQSLGLGGKELTDALGSIDTQTLIDLLNNKFPKPESLFRETLPAMINYYVPRTLQSRFVITNRIFDDNLGNDFVLFSGIDRVLLSQLCKKNVVETSSNVLRNKKPTSQFVFLECDIDFDSISTMFPKHAVHLLEYQDNELFWRKSRGNMSTIQKYVSTNQHKLTESEFVSGILAQTSSSPICISDTPGKGKSILLAQFANDVKKYHETGIVAFILIKELIQYLKSGNITSSNILSILSQFLSASNFSHAYLKSNTKYIRELMLDGFDEIRAEDTNFALKCVNEIRSVFSETRVWITSRPHVLPELENCLEVLGYNITPFSRKDQITFLSSFWSNCIKVYDKEVLSRFADHCLKTLEASLTTTKEDIAGIPLQCLLIGEVYEDDAKRFLDANSSTKILSQVVTTIAVLYRKLIEKKLENFKRRYNSNNLSKSEIFKAHMVKALEVLYPGQVDKFSGILVHNMSQQEILDFGLIEAKSIPTTCEFLHRTFAEYFVALFVSELMTKYPSNETFRFIVCIVMITENGRDDDKFFHKYWFESMSKFRENVICYFLNTFLEEADLNVTEYVSSISLEFVRPVAVACVYHNLENLFLKIILESKHKRDVINEYLLVKAVYWADVHFLTEIMVKYLSIDGNTPILKIGWERLDREGEYCRCSTDIKSPDCYASKHITKIDPRYTLLHVAVMRAAYATVDSLIKNHFQASIKCNSGNLYDDLICTLINYSEDDVDWILAEKRPILNYLANLNEDLLVSEGKSGFPLQISRRPNVELVLEIWKRTKRFYSKTNTLILVLNTLSLNMTCENFFTFIRAVCSDLNRATIEKVIKGYLWEGIRLQHDLNTEFLFYLKDKSSGFCDLNSDDRINMFQTALKRGQKENILEWMLNNLPYSIEDIKQLFTHSLLVANLNGLNALSVNTMKRKSLEQFPSFYEIFEFLFSGQKSLSIDNSFTISHLVSYFICKHHTKYFEEMDLETTLTNLIELGFSFFEEMSVKSFLSKSDECILQLVWLILTCSDFKQEIFLKWLKIYSNKIDIKTNTSSGNNLLHIFAKRFLDKEKNWIKYSFLDKCMFSRGFTEMYGDKNSKVETIDIWKVLVENEVNILQPNINKQTPICLLPSKKYPEEICKNVTDAILSAAKHMKTHHSDNIDNTHQIFYLVLKSHQIEVVQSVYEWYAEICKSQKISIPNVTVSFDDDEGNFLDAAVKSGNGDVVEFVINTLQIHIPLLPPPKLCIHHSIQSDIYEYKRTAKYIIYLGKIFPSQIKQLVNEPNDRGLNPLSLGAELYSDIVKVLHDFGANVNAADDNGNTPLHFTLMYEYFDEDVLKQFIEFGSHINAKNLKMETPLSTFVQNQNYFPRGFSRVEFFDSFILKFDILLKHKADPTLPDENGNTPVHIFVHKIYTGNEFHRIVKILIYFKFVHVLTIQNKNGQTPLQLADELFNINKDTKLLLTQHGIVDFEV